MKKKGQLSLSDAPTVVLLVGLVFLVMATIAFIGQKYGTAMGSTTEFTTVNETLTIPGFVLNSTLCNFETFAVTEVFNSSDDPISAGNYTTNASGGIGNKTSDDGASYSVSYTGTWGGTACQVTEDLNTEIANNTSIAGIVLTISLVGIVLTVLIGIFLVARAPGRA